jgi:retinol dehydrogenase-12
MLNMDCTLCRLFYGAAAAIAFLIAAFYAARRICRGSIYATDKRLDGKTVVVTGANTGIGYETAKDLCRRGARVVLLCRNEKRGRTAVAAIEEELRGQKNTGELTLGLLDLSSLESVRECAARLLKEEQRLDILVLNAGVMTCPALPRTKDGFDMQMGTNHLGHYLFTRLLVTLLKKTAEESQRARVVIVSSMAHMMNMEPIRIKDLNFDEPGWFHPGKAYYQSKLANILFGKELAKRLEGTGITTYSLHPGVVATELSRYGMDSSNLLIKWVTKLVYGSMGEAIMKTPWHGAQTSLYCCLDDSIKDISGRYYSDCAEKKPSAYARSEEDAAKLWDLSAKLTGCEDLSI